MLILDYALNGRLCWWLAPTYDMAGQVWRDLRRIGIEMNHGIQVSQADQRIDFPSGGFITIRSTHYPDNLRGMGLDFAVLDEAAFMESSVWPEVVRPMLLERQGGALFLSSPNGRNWFWNIYTLGLDKEEQEWASFHFTSYENPLIPASEIDAIKRVTPERVFRAEYLAMFEEDSGQVFRSIREAATAPTNPQPIPDRRYIGGIDWGKDGDFTAIAIIDAETHQMVALDRFNQVSWALQRGRLKALVDRWNPVVVWAEANSIGSPNIEALQAEGLPVRSFLTTAQSKNPLIEALALAIERGEIALLPDETLLNELAAYQLERLPAGSYRYGAPSGQHDDTVIALALAWHGVRHSGITLDFA